MNTDGILSAAAALNNFFFICPPLVPAGLHLPFFSDNIHIPSSLCCLAALESR